MPILPGLEFAPTSLWVGYRAAPTPQEVSIAVHTRAPSSEPLAFDAMMGIVEHVNRGAAGGAEFPAAQGFAEVLRGPPPEHPGPDFEWVLRWSAVSPLFLRAVVERLRLSGGPEPTVSMSIRGSLLPDGSPLSVTTREVLSWLDDPTLYPRRYPVVPFALDEIAACGFAMQLELYDRIDPETHLELENLVATWIEAVQLYVRYDGVPVYEDVDEYQFYSGLAKQEYRARLIQFEHTPGPSVDLLVNMLCRFHESKPIARAEIRL